MYWHYPLEKPHFLGGVSAGAIRDGHWKLIEWLETGKVSLFNLETDPGESTDLAGMEPGRARSLQQKLVRWRQEIGAPK